MNPRRRAPPRDAWCGKPRVRVLSYGGGLDSWAMLLDAVERGEPPELVIFADVADPEGLDPGEWPGTYRHLREVVRPFCERHGIEFVWLDTVRRPIRGQRSLFAYFETKHILPGRMSRLCTSAAKVERITDELVERFPDRPVEVWIGFEAGEEGRASRDPHAVASDTGDGWRVNRFPLIERGLCRCRCEALVRRLGYPVPRKSACIYCPYATRGDFQTAAREVPVHFARIVKLERDCRPTRRGKILTFGYQRGDGTDPSLLVWIAKPYRPARIACKVCGSPQRATKAAGCGYLEAA